MEAPFVMQELLDWFRCSKHWDSHTCFTLFAESIALQRENNRQPCSCCWLISSIRDEEHITMVIRDFSSRVEEGTCLVQLRNFNGLPGCLWRVWNNARTGCDLYTPIETSEGIGATLDVNLCAKRQKPHVFCDRGFIAHQRAKSRHHRETSYDLIMHFASPKHAPIVEAQSHLWTRTTGHIIVPYNFLVRERETCIGSVCFFVEPVNCWWRVRPPRKNNVRFLYALIESGEKDAWTIGYAITLQKRRNHVTCMRVLLTRERGVTANIIAFIVCF
jgi:hypothetical protein